MPALQDLLEGLPGLQSELMQSTACGSPTDSPTMQVSQQEPVKGEDPPELAPVAENSLAWGSFMAVVSSHRRIAFWHNADGEQLLKFAHCAGRQPQVSGCQRH